MAMSKVDLAGKTAERLQKKMNAGTSDIPDKKVPNPGGRPKKKDKKEQRIMVYVGDDEYIAFQAAAEERDVSMSTLARKLINDYLNKQKNNEY